MSALSATPAPTDRRPEAAPGPTPPLIGAMLTGNGSVGLGEMVRDVAERFFRSPNLDAVALVEGERPTGLLTRSRLLLKLARNFGYELYARKPVARVADSRR